MTVKDFVKYVAYEKGMDVGNVRLLFGGKEMNTGKLFRSLRQLLKLWSADDTWIAESNLIVMDYGLMDVSIC